MPEVSKAQARAMQAAAHGKSTLGIPKRVAQEYISAGPASAHLPEHVTKLANALKGKR